MAPAPGPFDNSVQPQALEAEEAVIGACLISPRAIEAVSEVLDAGDFFRESHSRIYRACLGLWVEGKAVDALTVTAWLEESGELEAIGGRVRIYEISALVPTSANARHYAEIVRERSIQRGFIQAGGQIAQLGWDSEGATEDKLLVAEELLDRLRASRESERDEVMNLHSAAEYLEQKFRHPPDHREGVKPPFSFMKPLGYGRLYVLGGYTGDLKTSTACQFFISAAKDTTPTCLLTLEMSDEDLAERLASTMGIPASIVQTGKVSEPDEPVRRHVLQEMTRLAEWAWIWDAPAVDIASIRRHVKVRRPRFLIVDHLHQFHVRAEYERQDLENLVRGLWRIAREFNIVVLLLAQLSRSGDKRHPFPTPSLSSLKGSGAIEQLAWAVWFVYRKRDENNLPLEDALFITAKSRSGITGIRPLLFHPREIRYSEVIS